MNASSPPPIPAETSEVARSLFNVEQAYMVIGDHLEEILGGIEPLQFGRHPGESEGAAVPWLSAMVTLFQFSEEMPDRQAAEAIGGRMDWKYALHLPLNYPCLKPESLCLFRQGLMLDRDGQGRFQKLLNRLGDIGLVDRRRRDRFNSRCVLLIVCQLSRLDELVQAMSLALESLAASQPEALRLVTLPHWYDRYYPLSQPVRLPHDEIERRTFTRAIGDDIRYLLKAVSDIGDQDLAALVELQVLRNTSKRHFEGLEDGCLWGKGCTDCRGRDFIYDTSTSSKSFNGGNDMARTA